MNKKILNTLLAGAAVATMSITAAQAANLDSVNGDVKFLYDGFDAAQTTYAGPAGNLCNTVASCDAASGAANAPGSNQSNDTWGITQISSIKENIGFGAATFWNDGDDDESLIAYFYGFNDTQVDIVNATETNIYSTGGHVAIYRVADTFAGTLDLTDQSTIEAALNALPSAYLVLDFVPGCDAIVTNATLCGTFDLTNLQGSSNGFAVAVGGDAMSKYPNEFQFEQSIEPCDVNVTCPTGSNFNVVVRSSSAVTTALPAPGALGLMGLGLVGLGLIGRRRKA